MGLTLLILPHQLYQPSYFPRGTSKVILYEHPHYFTAYHYNKKKLLLHRASMQAYFERLPRRFEKQYVEFHRPFPTGATHIFDPIDRIDLPTKLEVLESPNFLLTRQQMAQYREKTQHFRFYNFYMWSKKETGILPGVKSKDRENRRKLPKGAKLPPAPPTRRGLEEAQDYVERHFPDNPGNLEGFIFPVTRPEALRWLRGFVKAKLREFGPYQDAISAENPFLYHSLLSTSINVGLLQPLEVVQAVLKVGRGVPLNSLEGFIRQLFWREYQRYCYIYASLRGKNYFGGRRRLDKRWYSGAFLEGGGKRFGIPPLDEAIERAWQIGYLHHIERLMVVGNYMNLSGLAPSEGFRWFMEFSCDSYEWVMEQNVLDMVFFVSGGKTMHKPYLSSSNYIRKMSDYPPGEWEEEWNRLYHQFLKKHRRKLVPFRFALRLPKL